MTVLMVALRAPRSGLREVSLVRRDSVRRKTCRPESLLHSREAPLMTVSLILLGGMLVLGGLVAVVAALGAGSARSATGPRPPRR